jgi:hypothetical protein
MPWKKVEIMTFKTKNDLEIELIWQEIPCDLWDSFYQAYAIDDQVGLDFLFGKLLEPEDVMDYLLDDWKQSWQPADCMACPTIVNLQPRGAVINASLTQGETWVLPLRWKTSDYTVVDLSGYTAAMMIRQSVDGDALVSLTDADGIVLGGSVGTITATLTAAQTLILPAARLQYDLKLTTPDGAVVVIARGELSIIRTLTHA